MIVNIYDGNQKTAMYIMSNEKAEYNIECV
jgi:hypothetical protein